MKTPTLILIAGLVLTSTSFAVDPPPDGGYPNQNTAEGEDALFSLTTGANNTAAGYHALHDITDSSGNTAVGSNALAVSTAGPNTAIGAEVLGKNTTGFNNTAVDGLYNNTTGRDNTAVGNALGYNTTGSFNTAMGTGAAAGNGNNNCAIGESALLFGGGSDNVAIGVETLQSLTSGNRNVAIGHEALEHIKGNRNIGIGNGAGIVVQGREQDLIYIGSAGHDNESNAIRIGDSGVQTSAFIAGINGVTVPDGVEVVINPNGQLGTITSSARYKEAIRPMADASKVLLGLRPVSFSYKKELDPAETPQFGLVAEEVEKVDPDLVVRDNLGRPDSVRYQAVNAMLLNEFLKAHRALEQRTATIRTQQEKIEQLEATLGRLESALNQQRNQLEKLTERTAIHDPSVRLSESH